MKDYTQAEKLAIAEKVLAQRAKQAEKDKENRKLASQLVKLYREGKIKLPKT